jgi:hypothetical protein
MTPEEGARVRHGLPLLVGQLALVQEVEFSNGTIEVELACAPETLWLEPGTVAHFRNLTIKPR